MGRLRVDGAGDAAEAFVGLNRHEDRGHVERTARIAFASDAAARDRVRPFVLVLGVDVGRPDDAVQPQIAFVLDLAIDLREQHAADAHEGLR